MQKKLMVLFAFAIFVLVVGWAITPAQAHCRGDHVAKHKNCGDGGGDDGGGGGGRDIPVSVTFRECNGERFGDGLPVEECEPDGIGGFLPDAIQSDGGGAYIDGEKKVTANIRGNTGNLHLFLTRGGRFHTPIRTLFLDFSDCVADCNPPFDPAGFSVGRVTVFTSGIDLLRDMNDGDIAPLNMSVNMDLGKEGGIWRLFFDPSREDCRGNNIRVTRDDDADTWVIEADKSDLACLGEQVGANEFISRGRYRMPFKFTVETN